MNKETFEVGDTVYFVTYYMVQYYTQKFKIEEGKVTQIENSKNGEQILTIDGCLKFLISPLDFDFFVSHSQIAVREKSKEYARKVIKKLTEEYNKEKAKYEAILGE
jgi:hypothetical protein